MSGPGLNQRDAHHAIHRAAFFEAERLTLLLRQALRASDQPRALQVAALLIEHWQMRTLHHAEAEEIGWYREILAERPELQSDVIALTRDHELLRVLLDEIQGILATRGIASGVVERFEAMLLLNGIHSREEERRLLSVESAIQEPGDGVSDRESAPSDAWPTITTTPIPLAVARPALYTRLVALLRERGLSPADLQVNLRHDAAGKLVLHVTVGGEYAQMSEWPLETDAPDDAAQSVLHQIAEACEQAAKASYQARMHTPT